jgi:hypothetical protein
MEESKFMLRANIGLKIFIHFYNKRIVGPGWGGWGEEMRYGEICRHGRLRRPVNEARNRTTLLECNDNVRCIGRPVVTSLLSTSAGGLRRKANYIPKVCLSCNYW